MNSKNLDVWIILNETMAKFVVGRINKVNQKIQSNRKMNRTLVYFDIIL